MNNSSHRCCAVFCAAGEFRGTFYDAVLEWQESLNRYLHFGSKIPDLP